MIETLDRYDAVRDRLLLAYDAGKLVPFIGSGMSFPACRLWNEFVDELEKQVGYVPPENGAPADPAELVRRANRAMQHLRLTRTPDQVAQDVRKALGRGMEIPPATANLAKIYWPLVLSTNYDDLFWTAFANSQSVPLRIRGRSISDCHAVLSSLHTASEPILWALQGFLGQIFYCFSNDHRVSELSKEIVVGHQEYRQVTFNSPQFRRAFAEVFRSRSFLFLGFGLQDPYIMDLFSEILEMFGPNPVPHYAFARRDQVDIPFLAQRFNIIVIPYGNHDEVPGLLERLAMDVQSPRPKSNSWTYSMKVGTRLQSGVATGDFNVVAGALPVPKAGECSAISVGSKGGKLWLGETASALRQYVASGLLPPDWDQTITPIRRASMVFQLGRHPVFLVAARDENGDRDVRKISPAVTELVTLARKDFDVVHCVVLGAGKRRAQSASVLLIEMARGYSKWALNSKEKPVKFFVHVVAPDVLLALRSGQLNLTEALLCDDLRFWLELEDVNGTIQRFPYHCRPQTRVLTLISEVCGLDSRTWALDLWPAPTLSWSPIKAVEVDPSATLDDIGVVPGASLRFSFASNGTSLAKPFRPETNRERESVDVANHLSEGWSGN